MLWPSRTRRSEQKELEKRENKRLEDEEKGKNEKKLAQMLDENEVEMVALVAKQEQKERMAMAKKRKVDQLETNKLMTAQNVRFLSVKIYYCVLITFATTVLFRRNETPLKDI